MVTPDILVIWNRKRPLVIVGVCHREETCGSGRKTTENSDGLSRVIDIANIANYGQWVANLMASKCSSENVSHWRKTGFPKQQRLRINLQPSSIAKLCDFAMPLEIEDNISVKYGFCIGKLRADSWRVRVPAGRSDLKCFQDIVPECLRTSGKVKR
jgi:phenylalanyl-tRNA synthetase beta subunit